MRQTNTARIGLVALLVLSAVVVGVFAPGALARDPGADTTTVGETNATPIHDGETVSVTTTSTRNFTFDVTRGEAFTLTATLNASTSTFDDISVSVYDENGTEVGALSGGDDPASTNVLMENFDAKAGDVSEADQTYTVRVTGEGDREKRYNLTLETRRLDEYDPDESPESATVVDANATVDAAAANYDEDHYAVNLSAGDEMDIDVVSDVHDREWYEQVSITAPNGEDVALDDYDESFAAEQNGTYVVEVGFEPAATMDPSLDSAAYTLELDHSPTEKSEGSPVADPEPPENGIEDGSDDSCP
ncbi:hypothetical protein [Haloarcula nitratireducens]|uniref:Cell surface glycoprotein n=1 Tax=Haloarcula nitratireducens TaxID=2487749 RepID=A0AAW4P6Y1_9EURY|nr:hypothetical protein [Halomicroarcula nitratireducens]MBX0293670.1 hypothetical protein [Halomicroarcula nitratireducens]